MVNLATKCQGGGCVSVIVGKMVPSYSESYGILRKKNFFCTYRTDFWPGGFRVQKSCLWVQSHNGHQRMGPIICMGLQSTPSIRLSKFSTRNINRNASKATTILTVGTIFRFRIRTSISVETSNGKNCRHERHCPNCVWIEARCCTHE